MLTRCSDEDCMTWRGGGRDPPEVPPIARAHGERANTNAARVGERLEPRSATLAVLIHFLGALSQITPAFPGLMLRNNRVTFGHRSSLSYRGGSSGGIAGNRRLQRLIQMVLIVIFLFSLVYLQTHTKVKFSIPKTRQELFKRLSNPSIRARFHRREPGDRGLLGKKEKKITDEWDWDQDDGPYEKKFAAVIENK
ncbi:hypothetical protein FRC00_003736 [Tulasnella sp. 408]|nr:hypothetical protein FRC00_003736 [Tulasnella sp. 408]